MAIHSLAVRTTQTGAAAACLEIIALSTNRPRVLEVGISLNAATASAFALGRPAAAGITPTSPVALLPDDTNDQATTVTIALAWATPPTVPAAFSRRVSLPNTVGAGIIWTFPRGLVIPQSGSLVLWNITTVSAIDAWVVIDE